MEYTLKSLIKTKKLFLFLIFLTIISLIHITISLYNSLTPFSQGDTTDFLSSLLLMFLLPSSIIWGLFKFRNRHTILKILFFVGLILFILYLLVLMILVAPVYSCNYTGHCHWFEFFHIDN